MTTIEEYREFMNKGNKYNAVKTEYNGVIYDSKKEAGRAQELDLLVKAGLIEDLEKQYHIDCLVNGVKVFVYIADFRYFDKKIANWVIEDVKGMRTPVFNLKKKILEAQGYLITIV